jgi:hypothetical protein
MNRSLFTNGLIFDGRSPDLLADHNVVVEDGLIAVALLYQESPAVAGIWEGGTRWFLVPGLDQRQPGNPCANCNQLSNERSIPSRPRDVKDGTETYDVNQPVSDRARLRVRCFGSWAPLPRPAPLDSSATDFSPAPSQSTCESAEVRGAS